MNSTVRNESYYEALAFDKDIGATRGIDAVLAEHRLDALVLPYTSYYVSRVSGRVVLRYYTTLSFLKNLQLLPDIL
jgi:amidase